jgi:hypothetical protein
MDALQCNVQTLRFRLETNIKVHNNLWTRRGGFKTICGFVCLNRFVEHSKPKATSITIENPVQVPIRLVAFTINKTWTNKQTNKQASMPAVAVIHEPSTFSLISLSIASRMKLLDHQRVENFDGYLLTRSAVAWCSADEVEDGKTLERVSTRPIGP